MAGETPEEYGARKVREEAENLMGIKIEWVISQMALCESPIEKYILAALIHMGFYGDDNHPLVIKNWPGESPIPNSDRIRGDAFIAIFPQAQIIGYRVDFLIEFKPFMTRDSTMIVIECDGHDFHEKTKEQARRDKHRDRELTAAGFTIFRMTGSEIFRDPDTCLIELRAFMDKVQKSALSQARKDQP